MTTAGAKIIGIACATTYDTIRLTTMVTIDIIVWATSGTSYVIACLAIGKQNKVEGWELQ